MYGCLLHAPHWGPGLQPRHVSWLGMEPVTLWFTGWHSIHGGTPARLFFTISNSISQTMFHKTMAFLEILRNVLWIKECCGLISLDKSGLNKVKQIFYCRTSQHFQSVSTHCACKGENSSSGFQKCLAAESFWWGKHLDTPVQHRKLYILLWFNLTY